MSLIRLRGLLESFQFLPLKDIEELAFSGLQSGLLRSSKQIHFVYRISFFYSVFEGRFQSIHSDL